MKIKEVLEGWGNHLFPKEELKEAILEVSDKRLKICLSCEQNSTFARINLTSTCKSCGCNLIPKSKCLSCHCPLDKWKAITSQEKDSEISKDIEGL